MATAFAWVFWTAVGAVVVTYLGFPLLVLVRGRLRPRPVQAADHEPSVTLLIAAHNEQASIGAKLENALSLDYPSDRLEVIVTSDGSDDGTNDIVAAHADRRVRLLALPRGGKAAALNAGIAVATGEVLVFSDANSIYDSQAIRALVRPLADPIVGAVAGDQRYVRTEVVDGVVAGEQRYWDIDRLLKVAQSRAGSATSATGAIYAIRRELVDPVPAGVTDDFHTSTGVVVRGRRLVFAPDAIAWEHAAASGRLEFARKVRVITRGLRSVVARRELLDPRRHGFYALQLFGHKVLRRLMVLPLAALAVSAPLLWGAGPVYRWAAVGQAALYLGAVAGMVVPSRLGRLGRLLQLPTYFCMVNLACLRALWNVASGAQVDRWEPQRAPAAA